MRWRGRWVYRFNLNSWRYTNAIHLLCVKVCAPDTWPRHVVEGTQAQNMRRIARMRRGGGRSVVPSDVPCQVSVLSPWTVSASGIVPLVWPPRANRVGNPVCVGGAHTGLQHPLSWLPWRFPPPRPRMAQPRVIKANVGAAGR